MCQCVSAQFILWYLLFQQWKYLHLRKIIGYTQIWKGEKKYIYFFFNIDMLINWNHARTISFMNIYGCHQLREEFTCERAAQVNIYKIQQQQRFVLIEIGYDTRALVRWLLIEDALDMTNLIVFFFSVWVNLEIEIRMKPATLHF